jgi:hypothetical protein
MFKHLYWECLLRNWQSLCWSEVPLLSLRSFKSVISTDMSSGMYCRVKWLSTDVSEVRAVSIIRAMTIILHGSTSQKTNLNFILAAMRTWNLTEISLMFRHKKSACVSCLPIVGVYWAQCASYVSLSWQFRIEMNWIKQNVAGCKWWE